MDFLKLAFVFAAIVIALRKKVPVSVTLFSAGLLTALLFLVSPGDLLDGYWRLVTSNRFISLTSIIILITILGSLLRELGTLAKLSEACRDLYGGKRTAAAVVPPLIGLMPMPGGALLSAPLVDSVLNEPQYPAHLKCAVNYWSRHVVEHFMPIYPGIILSEAVTGMPALHLALMQSPLAIVMATLGFIFMLRRIAPSTGKRGELKRPLIGIVQSLWPIILAILLYGLLRLDLWLAVLISLFLLIIFARPNRRMIGRSFKTGLTYKLIFLVFGILSFQTALEISGAIASIQRLSVEYGFPEELIIISVGFTAGLLTGMYAAFVALAYSLLAGFLYQPEINSANIFLAYLSGYLGMMLSPTHLCLVLTNEYFRSNLLSVYKILIWPAILLGLAGYLIYLSPWPALF
jgi:integral membrane protein (TIGR00529 family)